MAPSGSAGELQGVLLGSPWLVLACFWHPSGSIVGLLNRYFSAGGPFGVPLARFGSLWALFGLHFTRFGSHFSSILDTPGASSAPEKYSASTLPRPFC